MRHRNFIISICSATVALALVPTVAMGQTTNPPTKRTITLINQCNFPVFPGATSGGLAPTGPCGKNGTCPAGQVCNQAGNPPPKIPMCYVQCQNGACATGQACNTTNNLCYWQQLKTSSIITAPSGAIGTAPIGTALDAFHLQLTSGSKVEVTVPILSKGGEDTVWSGNLWAGTDFSSGQSRTSGNAATGYCAASQNGVWTIIPCDAFTGSQNAPLTKAEFAFVNSTDFYDISAIHGANVPISMGPTEEKPSQNFGKVPPGSKYQKDYWCTAPGSVSKPPTADCDWVFKPPTNDVTKPGPGLALVQHQQMPNLCGDPKKTCPSGQVCGLAFDPSKGTDPSNGISPLYQECGNNSARGGTWSAIQICTAIDYNNKNLNPNQVSKQFINSLNCGTSAGSAGNAQLFQCIGPNIKSCYDPTADASCCGCPDWPKTYKPNTTPLTGKSGVDNACYTTNPTWTSVSGAWLPYIKTACPAAYSYQFDDVTSTFTCKATVPNSNSTINATNYTITFCPDGKTARVQ
jgi:hypothetical protein